MERKSSCDADQRNASGQEKSLNEEIDRQLWNIALLSFNLFAEVKGQALRWLPLGRR